MTEAFAKQIETEARQAMTELVAAAKLKKGDVLVVGCSSSEMVGGHIGKDSSLEAARALYAGAAPVLAEKGIWLAWSIGQHCHGNSHLHAKIHQFFDGIAHPHISLFLCIRILIGLFLFF